MKIELKLYASFSRYRPREVDGEPGMVDVPEGITIKGLLKELDIPADAVKIMFLNGLHAKGDEVLQEGDRLGVFPPVAGG